MGRAGGAGISCYIFFTPTQGFPPFEKLATYEAQSVCGIDRFRCEKLQFSFPQPPKVKHLQKLTSVEHLLALPDKARWNSAVRSLRPQRLFYVRPAKPQDPQGSAYTSFTTLTGKIWKETVTDRKETCKCKHITGSRVCLS